MLWKKSLLVVVLAAAALMSESFACSVAVQDLHQKNLLITHGANHFRVNLPELSFSNVLLYQKKFIGEDPTSQCPLYLQTSGAVTLKYKNASSQNCVSFVRVTSKTALGEPSDGPFQTLNFANAHTLCN